MSATQELQHLLESDIQQLNTLRALLEEEAALLRTPDVRGLEPLTRRKNDILDQIRGRAREKVHALVRAGYRPELGDPSRFIRSAGLTELADTWNLATAALADCKALNQQNSRIVGHLQTRLARLTDIFRGSSGQQKLYGASGQQTNVGQRNILASA